MATSEIGMLDELFRRFLLVEETMLLTCLQTSPVFQSIQWTLNRTDIMLAYLCRLLQSLNFCAQAILEYIALTLSTYSGSHGKVTVILPPALFLISTVLMAFIVMDFCRIVKSFGQFGFSADLPAGRQAGSLCEPPDGSLRAVFETNPQLLQL